MSNSDAQIHIGTFSVPLYKMEMLFGLSDQVSILQQTLAYLIGEVAKMAADLTALQAAVAKNTDVEASALALIKGIAAQLLAAKNDPVAIQGLVDKLNTSGDALAAAVAANTPAA